MVDDLHNEAVRWTQLADQARGQGYVEQAQYYAEQAADAEAKAFRLANEPTRTMLYVSALALAQRAGNVGLVADLAVAYCGEG